MVMLAPRGWRANCTALHLDAASYTPRRRFCSCASVCMTAPLCVCVCVSESLFAGIMASRPVAASRFCAGCCSSGYPALQPPPKRWPQLHRRASPREQSRGNATASQRPGGAQICIFMLPCCCCWGARRAEVLSAAAGQTVSDSIKEETNISSSFSSWPWSYGLTARTRQCSLLWRRRGENCPR